MGEDMANKPRELVHVELHTADPEAARALYGSLCGWQAETVHARGRPYLALEPGRGLGGGIVGCSSERPIWLPYVEVPSVTLATESARQLGATVLLEPREGPTGWRSVVSTPAGGEIAFWRAKR